DTFNSFSDNSNKKLSKIGKVLLLLMTPPKTCSCFKRYELETINFIRRYFRLFKVQIYLINSISLINLELFLLNDYLKFSILHPLNKNLNMKLNKYLLGFSAAAFLSTAVMAQTPHRSLWVKKRTNVKVLQQLSLNYTKKYKVQRQKALNYARIHNLPKVVTHENGVKSYLIKMDDCGNLIYRKAFNLKSSQTIGTDELQQGGSLNLTLAGEGMHAGVWDGGNVQGAHELLDGKVTYKDNASSYSDHATHVSGTMVRKEISPTAGQKYLARGMAFKADLWAYNWYNDTGEM